MISQKAKYALRALVALARAVDEQWTEEHLETMLEAQQAKRLP